MTAPFAGVARGKVAWSTPSTGGGDGAPVHGDVVSSMADTVMADGNNTDTVMADASRSGSRSSIEDIETVLLHLREQHDAPDIFMGDGTAAMPLALWPAVRMATTWLSSSASHGGAGVADHEPRLLHGGRPLFGPGQAPSFARGRLIAMELTAKQAAELTASIEAKSPPSHADREHDSGEGEDIAIGKGGEIVHVVDPDDGEATR